MLVLLLAVMVSFVSIIVLGVYLCARYYFLPVVLIGTSVLISACDYEYYCVPLGLWGFIAIPAFLVTGVSLFITLESSQRKDVWRGREQLGLFCGFAVLNALVLFVSAAFLTDHINISYVINYLVCFIHVAVFFAVYVIMRKICARPGFDCNQSVFLATLFLFAGSYCAYSAGYMDKNKQAAVDWILAGYGHYAVMAYGFYILWSGCVLHCWVRVNSYASSKSQSPL